ncbi:hypothetical protein [Pontibacter cellulosilyticus]|uniref:Uncharacterized protein n=1 Tax=Pontibacter cellulosilyticus TaxID=1720253 RepID=A0A923SJ00_9BACT|nr:hypothetical protein [Pontibacter cellulosilyticus]MBC5992201.1 hypothetical protein [Pontibacter cellulosilyticus]
MKLSFLLFPRLALLKARILSCLLLTLLWGSVTNTLAQQGRYLQTVNLYQNENRPFISEVHSLTGYILEGIKSGEITPYVVNYTSNKAVAFSADAKQNLLRQITASPDSEDFLHPTMLEEVEIDIIKAKGRVRKINYLNFNNIHVADKTVSFSVSFDQVATYLAKNDALWVKNAGPLLWNNNILHTASWAAFNVLNRVTPELEGDYVAVKLNQVGEIAKLEAYLSNHELTHTFMLPDSLYTSGEILPMSKALLEERYQRKNEVELKTKLPEIKYKYKFKPSEASYVLTQTQSLYLSHPANAAFSQPDQELSTLLLDAVSKGIVTNVYASDSLLIKMSIAEWNDNMKVKEYDLFSDSVIFTDVTYIPQAYSVIEVVWKQHFDAAGKVISKKPYALGLFLGAEHSPVMLESKLGYLSFEEVYQKVKSQNGSVRLLGLLENITSGKYLGYLSHTSHITLSESK